MAIRVIDNIKVAKQSADTAKTKSDSTLSMRMRVFEDGADILKATPLIDVEESHIIKGQVEGKSDDVLREDAVAKIKEKFQAEIDRYVTEQLIQSKVDSVAIKDSLNVSKVIKAVKP